MLAITSVYAAILAIVFVYLSARVISVRRRDKISLGAGGHADLEKRIRTHGNFAEYAPIALILMAALELNSAPVWQLHTIGVLIVIGRLCHPIGMSGGPINFRVGGMILTFLSLLAGAAFILARLAF